MIMSAEEVPAFARCLLESTNPLPKVGDGALALAWALKDLCYESWSSEPPRAVRAAQAVRDVLDAGVPVAQAEQIQALADWTSGIAKILGGEMAEAVHYFDLAETGLRRSGLPDAAAQTQVPKIMALSMLGQHDQATTCAEAAQKELLAVGNVRAAARVSQNLGGLHLHRDAYAQAALHYRQAAVLFARLGEHEQSVLADIGLADALAAMGDLEEALRFYARGRMRASGRNLGMALALVDESVALVDLVRGRYREALIGMESARRRYAALALPQYLAIAEKQLADTYLELRLLPEALALFEQTVSKFEVLNLPDEQAWALVQLGRTQALLGQASAAVTFASAAALFEAQSNQVGAASVALARAELALSTNSAITALAWADHAILGFTEAGQAQGAARAQVMRAYAILGFDQPTEAGEVFARALAHARAQGQLTLQVRCHTGLGLVAKAMGDNLAARKCFEAAIELFELQRRALPAEEMRSAFLADHLRPYEELLRLALAGNLAHETLVRLERFRARALDEQLDRPDGANESIDPEIQVLRERLNWLYRRVRRLQDEALDSSALNDELLRLEHELLERTRRHRLTALSPMA